jgi:hypothetical protein
MSVLVYVCVCVCICVCVYVCALTAEMGNDFGAIIDVIVAPPFLFLCSLAYPPNTLFSSLLPPKEAHFKTVQL